MKHFLPALFTTLLLATGAGAATLVHEYTFDDGTANDSVGSLNGTLQNGATISAGALQLDGVDDYVQLSGYAIPTGGADFSVAIRAANLPPSFLFTEMISQGSSGNGFYIGSQSNGTFRLTDQYVNSGVAFPTDGVFRTYVLSSGNSFGTKFYIDGVNVFSNSELNLASGGTNTRFGTQFGTFSEYFKGSIDFVKIYDGELADGVIPPSTPVPLPASLPLFAFGLGALLVARRQRRPAEK
jgi:hypothetical protein